MTKSEKPVTRRGVFKILGGLLSAVGLGALVGPALAYFWPKKLEQVPSEPVPVGPIEDFKVGDWRTISYGRFPAIVMHTPAGIRAYTAVCTHFACLVKYDPENDVIACPCHAGFFSSDDGTVISGPPPKELEKYSWFVDNGILYLGGEA